MPDAPTYEIEVQSGPVYQVEVTSTETSYTVAVAAGPVYQVTMQLGTGPAGSAATVSVDPESGSVPYGTPTSIVNTGTTSAAKIKFLIEEGKPGQDGTGTVNSVNGISPIDGDVTVGADDIDGLAAVATSGSYDDLTDVPSTFPPVTGTGATDAMPGDTVATDIGGAPASSALGVPVTSQTSAYTLVAADAGSIVEINSASAVNVTVPASVFSAGQIVEVCQYGAGQVTLVAGSGVTLANANGLKTAKQYSSISIRFRSGTEAIVSGDTAT